MYCFIGEDAYYYTAAGIKILKETYDLEKIIIVNAGKSIEDGIKEYIELITREDWKKYFGKVALLSPVDISASNPYAKSAFIEKKYLKNVKGIATAFQALKGIPVKNMLGEKFGVKFLTPNTTLNDYGGAERMRKEVKEIEIKEKYGLPVQGFLIAGIPGAGKSYFAECLAGEMNRFLIELNLAKFLEYEQPLMMVDNFFDFIAENEGQYIIRIDEIEKMLKGEKIKSVFGRLLTHLNNFSQRSKSRVFFVATANNLSELLAEHPEISRAGRFDYLLYLTFPDDESAKKITSVYYNKLNKKLKREVIPKMYAAYEKEELEKEDIEPGSLRDTIAKMFKDGASMEEVASSVDIDFNIEQFIIMANKKYREKLAVVNRFPYTPVEISYVMNKIFIENVFRNYKDRSEDLIKTAISYISPIQITLRDSITALEGKANEFRKI